MAKTIYELRRFGLDGDSYTAAMFIEERDALRLGKTEFALCSAARQDIVVDQVSVYESIDDFVQAHGADLHECILTGLQGDAANKVLRARALAKLTDAERRALRV
jgi:hypothetical protein